MGAQVLATAGHVANQEARICDEAILCLLAGAAPDRQPVRHRPDDRRDAYANPHRCVGHRQPRRQRPVGRTGRGARHPHAGHWPGVDTDGALKTAVGLQVQKPCDTDDAPCGWRCPDLGQRRRTDQHLAPIRRSENRMEVHQSTWPAAAASGNGALHVAQPVPLRQSPCARSVARGASSRTAACGTCLCRSAGQNSRHHESEAHS